MFSPKHIHELALKCVSCYLKQTCDPGIVMNPLSDVCKIDAYPDADFAGMFVGGPAHLFPPFYFFWRETIFVLVGNLFLCPQNIGQTTTDFSTP